MRVRGAGAGVVAGLAAVLGTGGLLAACAGQAPEAGRPPAKAVAHLVAFDSCSQLLDTVRTEALAEVGPYGLPTSAGATGGVVPGSRAALDAPMAAASAAPAAGAASPSDSSGTASSAGGTPDFSSTNVQEAGVDEPDLAKTDGRLLVALRQAGPTLEVADVGGTPRLRGSLSLSGLVQPSGLFLVSGNAVVLGAGPSPVPVPEPLASGGSTGTSGSPAAGDTAPVQSYTPTTVVAVVSLADPDHPSVTRSFTVQGTEVDARLIAGHVEVVVTSSPALPFVAPTDGSTQAQNSALAQNQAIIRNSQPADWLPSVTSEPSGVTRSTACTAAMHPVVASTAGTEAPVPSGLGTVSVVPIDPSAAQPGPEATVVGSASTVYASATSLYVATTAWTAPQPIGMYNGTISNGAAPAGAPVSIGPASTGTVSSGTVSSGTVSSGTVSSGPAIVAPAPDSQTPASTDISGFDLSDPGAPHYLGSAEVPGTLIGQYAMSDYQGYLRVATTVGSATPPPNEGVVPSTPSDNRVVVLQPQGGSLVTVSTISGLGSGEKIYAVRFIGPLGYVVTFRQTDPLYVVDLHDPHNPKLAGQLQLTGYSSFLQPVSASLLLGVGQEVDQNLRRTGLQVSLFDVSDPADPKLLSKDVLAGANSAAENDPHALLYWAPDQLAVMPVTQDTPIPVDGQAPTASASPFDGAVAFSVAGATVTEAGRVSQPAPTVEPGQSTGIGVPQPMGIASPALAPMPQAMALPYYANSSIERELVVGSMLYTVSESGIMASTLGSFTQVAWMAYT